MAYVPFNPLPGPAGRFGAFRTLTDEQSREALREEWSKRVVSMPGETCPRCKGRGYTKQDGRVGCETCHGRGAVNV
jgi:hypothetical protein